MINKANFVYSKAAAARILDVKPYVIRKFEIWSDVCFVQIRIQKPMFISKKVFRQHFVDMRIERSRPLQVAQVNEEHFRVVNGRKGTAYSNYLFEDGLDCECEDYKNQIAIFNGRACCKHNYAVLRWLGYNRLQDYVEAYAKAT